QPAPRPPRTPRSGPPPPPAPSGRAAPSKSLELGQGLKAGCKVRRVSDHGVLAPRPRAAEVADQHHAARDADANRERFRGARLESGNRGNDIEPCPHGSLGIVFVRDWITGISQYPVAPELGAEE